MFLVEFRTNSKNGSGEDWGGGLSPPAAATVNYISTGNRILCSTHNMHLGATDALDRTWGPSPVGLLLDAYRNLPLLCPHPLFVSVRDEISILFRMILHLNYILSNGVTFSPDFIGCSVCANACNWASVYWRQQRIHSALLKSAFSITDSLYQ